MVIPAASISAMRFGPTSLSRASRGSGIADPLARFSGDAAALRTARFGRMKCSSKEQCAFQLLFRVSAINCDFAKNPAIHFLRPLTEPRSREFHELFRFRIEGRVVAIQLDHWRARDLN